MQGDVSVPGDKSIGHRALMIGALCDGAVRVTGLGTGQDNRSTGRALAGLGIQITSEGDETVVHGRGLQGLQAPTEPIDCGNSGTTMRVLLGILAGQDFEATLTGDHSLSRRPMRRVLDPLTSMGLEVLAAREGTYPPLTVRGRTPLAALDYASPIASAQVKTAVLLAGLFSEGGSTVTEPHPSRDHTERMLAYLGAPPVARPLHVPGDLSSAAFLFGAALLVPGSRVTVQGVGLNPTRTGVLDVFEAMGAELTIRDAVVRNGEPSATVTVALPDGGALRGVDISGDLTVRAIDELPLIATVASRAAGVTRIRDAAELRVKESDRVKKTVELLRSFGVAVDEHDDGLTVHGDPQGALTAGDVDADGDHRIAMSASLLALIAPAGSRLQGRDTIATSFPTFHECLMRLGAEWASS